MPVLGPYLIDTEGYSKWVLTRPVPGPFFYGTTRFIFWWRSNVDPELAMFKSTDGGVTWAVIENLYAPTWGAAQQINATTIRIAFPEAITKNVRLIDFAMDTETFSDVSTDSTTNDFTTYYRVGTEDWVFLRVEAGLMGSGRWKLYLRRWDGSSWLADILVSDNVDDSVNYSSFGTAVVGAGDILHIIYSDTPKLYPNRPEDWYYRRISPDGTMNSPVLIHHATHFWDRPLWGQPVIVNGVIVFPHRDLYLVGSFIYWTPSIYYGDEDAASPSFTFLRVADGWGSENQASLSFDGTLAYIWYGENSDPYGPYPDRLYYKTFDGVTLGDAVLVYDQLENPPTGPGFDEVTPGTQFLHDLAPPVQLSTGGWEVHIALEYKVGSIQFCTGFYWKLIPPFGVVLRSRICYRKPFFPPR
jgi:hypothetical protein